MRLTEQHGDTNATNVTCRRSRRGSPSARSSVRLNQPRPFAQAAASAVTESFGQNRTICLRRSFDGGKTWGVSQRRGRQQHSHSSLMPRTAARLGVCPPWGMRTLPSHPPSDHASPTFGTSPEACALILPPSSCRRRGTSFSSATTQPTILHQTAPSGRQDGAPVVVYVT